MTEPGKVEMQEAVKNLRTLKEKAQRLSDSLKDVADWLAMASAEGREFDPNASFWAKSNGAYANIKDDENLYRLALNYDELVSLVDQIITARKAVASAREGA